MDVSSGGGSLGTYYADAGDAQAPRAVAVVMTSVLRPSIVEAVTSVYRQAGAGRIQLMIGVDKAMGAIGDLTAVLEQRPPNVSAMVLTLPYSTSVRHGGVHPATDGGSLRSILTFMANSRHVAYLDDDNAWEPDHLASLLAAVRGKAWAWSQRMLIDVTDGREIGVDRWDSVGVGRGRFAADGGFVDPNCLLVDKVVAARAFGRWSEGPGMKSDRSFFAAIREAAHGAVERPTTRYFVRPGNDVFTDFIRDGVEFA